MGVRGELFTTEVLLENRTYFFNVKENRTGDVFLQVVESKSMEGNGFDRRAIVVFEDDMQKFLQGLENTLKFIEKNRKEKQKNGVEKAIPTRKKLVRRQPGSSDPRSTADSRDAIGPRRPLKPARRVKVIAKKDLKKE